MCMVSKHVSVQQLLLLRIYWVSWFSLSLKEEFQHYSEELHVFHRFVDNYLCARSPLQTQSMRHGNWKVHQENRNRDWSKKWLQQNSRYAVKVIAKGGFISASRLASHAGVFRGARFSSLPTNACSTEDNIPFPGLANHIVLSKFWKVDLDRKVIW